MDIPVTLTDTEWPDVIDALETQATELDNGSDEEDVAVLWLIIKKIRQQIAGTS